MLCDQRRCKTLDTVGGGSPIAGRPFCGYLLATIETNCFGTVLSLVECEMSRDFDNHEEPGVRE